MPGSDPRRAKRSTTRLSNDQEQLYAAPRRFLTDPTILAGHRLAAVWSTSEVRPASALSRHDLQISEVGIGELQGQASVLDDVLHDEGGDEFLHAGQGGELGVVELLEGG